MNKNLFFKPQWFRHFLLTAIACAVAASSLTACPTKRDAFVDEPATRTASHGGGVTRSSTYTAHLSFGGNVAADARNSSHKVQTGAGTHGIGDLGAHSDKE